MADKRGQKRHRKRLKVRYGIEDAATMGFTEDISEQGIFIKTGVTKPPQTVLTIELTTPDDDLIVMEGTVQWVKNFPPSMLRAGKKGGMGIKISRVVSGEKAYRKLWEMLNSVI